MDGGGMEGWREEGVKFLSLRHIRPDGHGMKGEVEGRRDQSTHRSKNVRRESR